MTQPSSDAPITETKTAHPNALLPSIMSGVIILFAISAITYLTALGRDPAQVIALLTAIGAPTIASLVSIFQNKKASDDVAIVKTQTNGALTALMARLENVEAQNAELTAQRAQAAGGPVYTGPGYDVGNGTDRNSAA